MRARGRTLSIPRLGALAIVVATAALAACQVLVGVTDEEGTARLPPGSAVPTSTDLCPHAEPPKPPSSDASDGDDLPPMWFSMTNLDGLARADGRPVGFDLDGRCTGFPLPTAFDGGAPCARFVMDEPGGVDNSAARMFGALPSGYGKSIFDVFQSTAKAGARTLLVYISKYNGRPDDPTVEARIVPSEALQTSTCDGGPPLEAGAGCDTWAYAQGSLTPFDGGAAPPVLHEGYVSEGRLVLGTKSAIDLDLVIGQGLFPFTLSGAVLVARFSERAGPSGAIVRTLNGVLGGRVSTASLLSAVSRNASLCTAPQLEAFKQVVCDHRDMPSSLTDDPLRACTHVSVGLAFQSIQARLGTSVAAPAPPAPCNVPIPTCE